MLNTHIHTHSVLRDTGWMEPRERIGHNLDICRHGPPTNQISGL